VPELAYPTTLCPGDLVWLAADAPPALVRAAPRVIATGGVLTDCCMLVEILVRPADADDERRIRLTVEDRLPVERGPGAEPDDPPRRRPRGGRRIRVPGAPRLALVPRPLAAAR